MENIGKLVIGSRAKQVYENLAELTGDEHIGHVRYSIVVNLSAYHAEGRVQFPVAEFNFLFG